MKKFLFFLLLVFLAVLAATSFASNTPTTLTRQHDPVVLTGNQLPDLLGTAINEIFVYTFTGGTPAQIPFQIDEQDANGMFVPNGDGLLGGEDELAFMASNAGAFEADPILSTPGGDVDPIYILTLTDPLTNEQAWAYLYTSPDLAQTFTEDYVHYDAGNDRITSPGLYSVGFNATGSFRDYLTLGGGGDILDRDKVRLDATFISIPFTVTEDAITKDGVHAIDGPVRVTRVVTSTVSLGNTAVTGIGTAFFYGNVIIQPSSLTTPASPVIVTKLRSSIDFNSAATGVTYFDANNPAGVTIDGVADSFDPDPAAEWQEATGTGGTIITVLDIPDSLPGTSTYYKDDSTPDTGDTGDQMSYGDAGFQVSNPPQNATFELLTHTYFLNGQQSNIGAVYQNYYSNPLTIQIALFDGSLQKIYLPIVKRGQ